MDGRRGRHEALRRRAFAIGIAISLALHVAALALVRFRVDVVRAPAADAVRLLPRVQEDRRLPEPAPERLIRIRQPEPQLAAGVPAVRERADAASAAPAPVVRPLPGQGGAAVDAAPIAGAGRPAVTGPAVLTLDVPDQRTGVRLVGVGPAGRDPGGAPLSDPGGVPLYEPGSIWRVKSGWLTGAGLSPRGAAVAVWVVGCPAPRTIVSSDPDPTFRGRPCH